MVCKFKFVFYGHNEKKIVLYVLFGRPSEVQSIPFLNSAILRFIIYRLALAPKFVLALEPTVLKLEGLSFRIRHSIYVLNLPFKYYTYD